MPEPRFKVVTVTGYPITLSAGQGGNSHEGLSATVLDTFYGTEIATFASESIYGPNGTIELARRGGGIRLGEFGALALAGKRCAELNEWDEREAARSVA